jgi:hypothetical protein
MIDSALLRPASVPQIEITQMRVIAKERTGRSRWSNENTQTIAPAGQIRPDMWSRQKYHLAHTLDKTMSVCALSRRVRRLSQNLFDDKAAETVADQNQLAFPKIRFHQQQIEDIGRTVGQFHR